MYGQIFGYHYAVSTETLFVIALVVLLVIFVKFRNRRRPIYTAPAPAPVARRPSRIGAVIAATFRGIWNGVKAIFRLFKWKSANARMIEAFIASANENVGRSSAPAVTTAKGALARMKAAGDASRLNHDAFMLFVPNLQASFAGQITSRMEDILEDVKLAAKNAASEKILVVDELTATQQDLVFAQAENTRISQLLAQTTAALTAVDDGKLTALTNAGRALEEAALVREIIANPRAATLSAARGELKGMEKQAQMMRPAPQSARGGGNNNQNRNQNQGDSPQGGSDNNGGNNRRRRQGNQNDENQNDGNRTGTGG